jgi:hypothetical protein
VQLEPAIDEALAELRNPKGSLTNALRERGRSERDWEERRLLKRQKRAAKGTEAEGASRSGSVAPGTPAPEQAEAKAPTKKELKAKSAAAKMSEANNAASANRTSMAFLGSVGFGGRKKKQYSWMSAGGGSGASTPARPGTPGVAASPAAAATPAAGGPAMLTPEGRTRFGVFREDGAGGKKVQLRDWIVTLESDGRDPNALQTAYDQLDASAR